MEVDPICVILVKSDSKGDRLLFRYPFESKEKLSHSSQTRRSPFAMRIAEDLLFSNHKPVTSNISKGVLIGFTDEVLSTLFAVKTELSDRKFELKVNDVRFVGHPTLLQHKNRQGEVTNTEKDESSGIMLINIVFALSANASHSVVRCYHDLSKRLGIVLRHEEKRCGYMSDQTTKMQIAHDEGFNNSIESTFKSILEKEDSTLANNIKKVYTDLCATGIVSIRINKWIPLSFCLPQKVHQWHMRGRIVEPEEIERCLRALRPYHSLLLLYPVSHLSDFTSLDSSPTLVKMLVEYSPMKNLQSLAADADLTLTHVFELTAHLVYWAKATVIFPVCSKNKYVISPNAPVHLESALMEKFSESFPGSNLIKSISEFSLPTSLGQKINPLSHPTQQQEFVKKIIWMLQHHLLVQLHTYVQYLPTENGLMNHKNDKKNMTSPSPRNSCVLSTSYPLNEFYSTRTESESGASTISETHELLMRNYNLENLSFASADDDKHDYQEELLLDFPDDERSSIFTIQAASHPEDLKLFAKLCRKQYFQGEHHIEEIMYLENLRRSQLLQLLDKFREVLVTYETEDPAIALFSCSS